MKTYQRIYHRLVSAQDFVTGQTLATELNLSRTAVWKAIQTLEEKGIAIQSVKKKGYKYLEGDLLLPQLIQAETGLAVHLNEQSQSTQLDAKRGIEEGLPGPSLYLAPSQSGAKGRFGRQFFADQAGGIYMSLHLQPNLPMADTPPYTLMVASSIVKAISRLTGIETQIKWVNDIYLGQKKVAGILTEAIASVETGLVTDVIIGVGINFNIRQFPAELEDKAASLFRGQAPLSRNQLISLIWQLFLTTPEKDLVKVYKEKSLVLDRQVTFSYQNKELEGLAVDISDRGELLVKLADGSIQRLNSGEVSLSSW